MIQKTFRLLYFLCFVFMISCKTKLQQSTNKIPTTVTPISEVQKIIINKNWQVIDAAIINGSRTSAFAKTESSTETIAIPNKENLNWFSELKDLEKSTDFAQKFLQEQFVKLKTISLQLKQDSIATVTGLENSDQKYYITDLPTVKEANGIKLKLVSKGNTLVFGNIITFTATYYVLSINEKYLFLLSPNKINDEKVVLLLEAK